jgi:hypothetical protein
VKNRQVDLVYICDWLPPDYGPTGQYAVLFARERAERGEHVTLYGLSTTATSTETECVAAGSLTICRLRARTYERTNFKQRAIWTLRTNVALIAHAFSSIRNCREVLFTGSPPFLLHFLAPLNLFLRKKLTYRITDFFPESLMAERSHIAWPLRLLYRLTVFWRRRVSQFEILGEDQRRRLVDIGIAPDRMVLKRDPSPVVITQDTLPLERPAALSGFKILLYSGNFGIVHDYKTFLAAYRKHHQVERSERVALWLNAAGTNADLVERELKKDGLPYFRTRPIPLEQVARLLVTPDAHLITLLDKHWGYSLPSKVYGCIASRLPVIYVGPIQSDVHLLCSTLSPTEHYHHVSVGDVGGLLAALDRVATFPLQTSGTPRRLVGHL